MLDGIIWVLEAGASWRKLPEKFGPWQTVYGRFLQWRRDGVWGRLVGGLLQKMQDEGRIDMDEWPLRQGQVSSLCSLQRGDPTVP